MAHTGVLDRTVRFQWSLPGGKSSSELAPEASPRRLLGSQVGAVVAVAVVFVAITLGALVVAGMLVREPTILCVVRLAQTRLGRNGL